METLVQIIQLLFTILIILLILRLLFAIIGNRGHPIVSAIFALTEPIVRPFRGMVRASHTEIVATLLALIAVIIVQYIVLQLLHVTATRGRIR